MSRIAVALVPGPPDDFVTQFCIIHSRTIFRTISESYLSPGPGY